MNDQVPYNSLLTLQGESWRLAENDSNQFPTGSLKLCLFADTNFAEQQSAVKLLLQTQPFAGTKVMLRKGKKGLFWTLAIKADSKGLVLTMLEKSEFDYLFWPENLIESPKLLVFDMDSTFIQIEVIDELAKYHGVGEIVANVTERAMQGELDFAESLVERVACLKGLSSEAIEEIAQRLPLSKGISPLCIAAKNSDCKISIVSGGFTPFVEKLKKEMGLFQVKANHLEVIDEKLTGKVLGDIVDAEAKATFVLALCEQLGIQPAQAMAIGDGANDLKMMSVAGFNLAFHAKPAVQAAASGRMNSTSFERLIDIFEW